MKLRTHAIYVGLLLTAVGWIILTMDTSPQTSPEAGQLDSASDVRTAEVTAATASLLPLRPRSYQTRLYQDRLHGLSQNTLQQRKH